VPASSPLRPTGCTHRHKDKSYRYLRRTAESESVAPTYEWGTSEAWCASQNERHRQGRLSLRVGAYSSAPADEPVSRAIKMLTPPLAERPEHLAGAWGGGALRVACAGCHLAYGTAPLPGARPFKMLTPRVARVSILSRLVGWERGSETRARDWVGGLWPRRSPGRCVQGSGAIRGARLRAWLAQARDPVLLDSPMEGREAEAQDARGLGAVAASGIQSLTYRPLLDLP